MTNRKLPMLATLALLGGCYGTSTGNPTGGSSDEGPEFPTPGVGGPGNPSSGDDLVGGGHCKEVSSREVADDEQTPLGFSVRDVLALIPASRTETLQRQPARIGTYGPEQGEQSLMIGFERKASKARFVDYEPQSNRNAIAVNCADALRLEVDITLKSARGALNERLEGHILQFRSKEFLRLSTGMKTEGKGGTLQFSGLPAGAEVHVYDIRMTLTPYGTTGEISATVQQSASGTVSATSSTIATWGLGPCSDGVGVPLESMVGGTSGANLLALVRDNAAAQLTWQDGMKTALTLGFEPTQSGVCAVLADDAFALEGKKGTLLLRGTLTATSADQHVRARWPVVIAGRPNSGVIDKLTITLDDRVSRTDPSLEQDFGVHGFDVAQYDSFGVGVRFELTTAGSWSGELNVNGFDTPNCSSEPIRDANGQVVGSPACPGSTQRPVARGTLSD